ncbi:MAG: hypothetical protein ABI865_04635 [Nitrosospira sp.]
MPYENYRNTITMPDYHRAGIQAVHIFYRQPAAMAGNDLLTRRLNLLR